MAAYAVQVFDDRAAVYRLGNVVMRLVGDHRATSIAVIPHWGLLAGDVVPSSIGDSFVTAYRQAKRGAEEHGRNVYFPGSQLETCVNFCGMGPFESALS